MANDVKIFKNQVIGTPKSSLIIDNKIKGAFGELANVSKVSGNIAIVGVNDNYTYESMGYGIITPPSSAYAIYTVAVGQFTHKFSYNIPISLKFTEPIENVTPESITARLLYQRIDGINDGSMGALTDWASAFYYFGSIGLYPVFPKTESIPVNSPLSYPLPSNYARYSEDSYSLDLQIAGLVDTFKVTPFSLDFDFVTSAILNGKIDVSFILPYQGSASSSFAVTLYRPTAIEITVLGDTYVITTTAFQIGEKTNAHELPKSTLLTSRAMYKDVPLYQHLSNKIINEWKDGKQTMSLTKVVNENNDLVAVDDTATVLNVRDTDFTDLDKQSIARKRDGTAKEFKITSAEFAYDGSYRQNLEMAEKTIEEE